MRRFVFFTLVGIVFGVTSGSGSPGSDTHERRSIELPVLDLSEKVDVSARKLSEAAIKYGGFYAENHGMSVELSEMFSRASDFFSLSGSYKSQFDHDQEHWGYVEYQDETSETPNADPEEKLQTQPDTKEGFYIGDPQLMDAKTDRKMIKMNQWPDEDVLPTWKAFMTTYITEIQPVAAKLTQLVALSLNLPIGYFNHSDSDSDSGMMSKPTSLLYLLHYYGATSQPHDGVFGIGSHSDYGFLTLLLTDENRGLQLQLANDEWVDVESRPGSFLVLFGHVLQTITDDFYIAVKHRVLLDEHNQHRYSIPFFYDPDTEFQIECLPAFQPCKYAPYYYHDYLTTTLQQTHVRLQEKENCASDEVQGVQKNTKK